MWRSCMKFSLLLVLVIAIYFVFSFKSPRVICMPVKDATRNSYDQNSFGAPRQGHTHKGVDIFARKGTAVLSATSGVVIFTGYLSLGGKAVTVLSPDIKFFYYAHLDTILTSPMTWVSAGELIGRVGNTGNARNTPSHLHFSVCQIFPYKRFFDPVPLLNSVK